MPTQKLTSTRAGAIPVSIGNLTKLTWLRLEMNKLEGESVYVQFYIKKEANRGTFLARSLGAQVQSRLSSGG